MTWLDYVLMAVGGTGIIIYLLARAEMHSRWPRTERREKVRP